MKHDLVESRERAAGTVHIYAPGCTLWEDTRTADLPLQEQYMMVRWVGYCPLKTLVDSRLRFARVLASESRAGELMLTAAELCNEAGDSAFWKAQAILMELVHLLRQARRRADGEWVLAGEGATRDGAFSEQVTRYLRQNVGRALQTTHIADHMNVSESTLNHKFKAETGHSPMARFGDMKIEFVKGLLLKGERLKVIAPMAGYYDEYYLSKSFKKTTGLSPRQFVAAYAESSSPI